MDEYTSEERELLDVFQRFDDNNDGVITRWELAAVFREVEPVYWDDSRIDSMLSVCDFNGDGRIDYTEFVTWLVHDDAEWKDARVMAQLNSHNEKFSVVKDSRGFCKSSQLVSMELVTSKDTKLGVKLASPDTLEIKKIREDGLFAEWNTLNAKANPPQQVSPGDRIISVNGLTSPQDIMKEMRLWGNLDIVIRPAAGTLRHKLHLEDFYEVSPDILDEGRLACVRCARNLKTDEQMVVRSIHKKTTSPESVEQQISLLTCLDHPNIVKLYDIFEDFLDYNLVFEHCSGGEVFEKILVETRFSELQAAKIQQQILSAVAYIHSLFICHRDLKPENLVLETETELERCVIKIVDWHYVRKFTDTCQDRFYSRTSSMEFSAPEILARVNGYDHRCDLWSAGCIMYFMIAGYPPFCGETDLETEIQIRRGFLKFPAEEFTYVSSEAKELLAGLVNSDVKARLTAEQANRHPWIDTYGTLSVHKSLKQESLKMKEYIDYCKFKKHALFTISRHLSSDQLQDLRNSFYYLDSNKDGTITYLEFKQGLGDLAKGVEMDHLKEVFEGMDVDASRRINYSEFIAATMDARHFRDEAALWSAFQLFDPDGSGCISKTEIARLLEDDTAKKVVGDLAEKVFADYDTNGDDFIDFHEFVAAVRGHDFSSTF